MNKTILIVDDSMVARMMIRNVIVKNFPDWNILEADNSKAGLELSANNEIDIAVLDLHMPEIEGIELATILKQTHPEMPISILTADIQDAIRDKALDLGLGFINKPVEESSLMQFLSQIESRSQ